ncbi:ABC transporter permease [Intrasporangium calvum]|uniref:ABC transporter permease n=1 Tax=Intrasporangium calvum TaxID=53358 RepID=UPI000DF5F9A1|nr:ABC transporter permease [Intrasporangium calvum]AXG13353.1 ABC transporter permease [Intrasporangium calvum]
MTATTTRPATPVRPARSDGGPLTGFGTLLRLIGRRDRVRVPLWILAITATQVAGAAAYPGLYPDAAARLVQAEVIGSSPAMKAMTGPGHGLDDYTFGAMMTNEYLGLMVIFAALMSVFMVVRHTRAEEEEGRAELVRANVTGSAAALSAALTAAVLANVVLGLLVAAGMASLGIETIDWPGSLLYGAAFAAVGIVFAAIAAVTTQVTQFARAASGMAGAFIGAAYLLRAIGDVMDNGLSWLSPIGWSQATAAYVDDNWWPIILSLPVAGALAALAFRLAGRRDVGAGLRAERRGVAQASRGLGTPLGLAWRLQRSTVMWWSIGMFVFGASYGSAIDVIEDYADNDVVADLVESMGGTTLTDSYLAMIMGILAIVVSIFAVTAALRPRREETSGRAESVLATGVSRAEWYASHLVVALLGSVFILFVTGLGLGLAALGTATGGSILGQVIPAMLAYTPAVWVVVGVAVLAVGWAPRAALAAWLLVVYAFFMRYMGALLDLPQWMMSLSPFSHIASLPAEDFRATPVILLTVIALAFIGLGLVGFHRRDVEAT